MLPVLLIAALASAAEFKPAGKATASGVSELTLFAGIDPADPFWYVEGKINDKPVLLRIATEADGLTLTEAAAGRVGLKVAGKDDKKTAAVPALSFGETAKISSTSAKVSALKEFPSGADGSLGIAAFPGLAWAIDPSVGKVKVGPSGAGSVADGIGTGSPFSQLAARKQAVGEAKLGTPNQQDVGALALGANASFSGVSLGTTLATGRATSRVYTEVDGGAEWFQLAGVENPKFPLPPVDGAMRGETELEWREVKVGSLSVWTPVERAGAGVLYRLLTPSRVGQDVLAHSALGVDSARKLYAIKAVTASAAVPYADVLEARLRAAVDEAAGTTTDPDAAKAALAGALAPLVGFLNETGQYAEGIEAATRWTAAAPERCASWLALGEAQLGGGDASAAIPNLQKAGDMYRPWAARSLAERTELAGSEDKRSKAPGFDGLWSQPSGCFVAWGELAVAQIVAGKAEAVASLYPKYADLDVGLPLAAGSALLLKGERAAAEAAYRQAVQLSYLASGPARGGMLLATQVRNTDLALAQFDATPLAARSEFRFLLAYADVLRTKGGPSGAMAGLEAVTARSPGSAAAWLALASEQAVAGAPNTVALENAARLLSGALAVTPRLGSAHALEAERLRMTGKLAEAAAEAEKATTLAPQDGVGWFVRARVADAAGDAPRAAELRKRAGQAGAADPVYASLLATTPG